PYIYKFWDEAAAESGMSGRNYPLLTYADVLLTLAEARAQIDGGTTNNADAINAWFKIRNRANPDEAKPALLSADDVLKERFWEICFEGQTWFDMIRTRKALNVTTRNIVNLLGYNAPSHPEGHPFKEDDLLFPYPLREKRLNPNLVRN
ncbi:MAG: RagB/SusD family nutrient uptake outer membrane protein, partial [Prolixibacteraceae bacterium]